MMKWLIRVWLGVNILVLAHAILARETPSIGGELAMVMFLLNMPSSLLTGIGLNSLGLVNPASHTLKMLWIWIPFFTLGAIQWALLKWLVRKFSG